MDFPRPQTTRGPDTDPHQIGNVLPKLARTELWIHESLDEARVRLLLRDISLSLFFRFDCKGLAKEVLHRGCKTESLDALSAPLGRYLIAGSSPDFLGIALKKSEIELPSKAIDQEVLKTFLVLYLMNSRSQVTRPHFGHANHAQISEGRTRKRDGVIEEAAKVINAALARANQHAQIRIRQRAGASRGGSFVFRLRQPYGRFSAAV